MENDKPSKTLYTVVRTQFEKLPFSDETYEYMPKNYRTFYSESFDEAFNPERDIEFSTYQELIPKVYASWGKTCPIPVHSFEDLLEQRVIGTDGEEHVIRCVMTYLNCYGLEYSKLYYFREYEVLSGIALNPTEAEMLRQSTDDSRHRVLPILSNTSLSTENGAIEVK